MHRDRPRAAHRVEVLSTLAGLQGIAQEWDTLASTARSPVMQADWVAASLTADCDGPASPAIVTLWRGDRLVAGVPLVATRSQGAHVLKIAGAELLAEPNSLLWVDRAALTALLRGILALRTPIQLLRMPADDAIADELRGLERRRALTRVSSAASYPVLPLTRPQGSLLSSRLRSDLRRARRKAEALGEVQYRMSRPDPVTALPELHAAFEVEAAGWKSGAGTALTLDAPRRRFYEHYAVRAARKGALRIATLSIGDQPAAVQVAVEANGGYWILKIGYDARFAESSPGQLLMLEALGSAVADGLDSFEMLGSVASWTRRWCPSERPTDNWVLYPWSVGTGLLVASTLRRGRPGRRADGHPERETGRDGV